MKLNRIAFVDNIDLDDVARDRLQQCSTAHIQYFDSDPADEAELNERVVNADALIVSWRTPVSAEFLRAHHDLRYIGLCASPFADPTQCNIDLPTAHDLGVIVSALGQYGDEATAEWVIASMLNAAHHIGPLAWREQRTELFGKQLAIIGLGPVGLKVAVRAKALGMRISYTARQNKPEGDTLGFVRLPIAEALEGADVVSIHIAKGVQIMAAAELDALRPDALVINTSIGSVIEPTAFGRWLAGGGIAIGDSTVHPALAESMRTAANGFLSPQPAAETVEWVCGAVNSWPRTSKPSSQVDRFVPFEGRARGNVGSRYRQPPMLWLLNAKIHILNADILWREIIGNVIGLLSAIGGMRRRIWAWPVGMVANVMLFTVFLGGVFATPQDKDLYGQAGRQVFFFLAGLYGWWRWNRNGGTISAPAIVPRWATMKERAVFVVGGAIGVGIAYAILRELGSYGPLADAWIFVGSLLATLGMARGYVEFWLIWIAVDLVGVPLLLQAGYYPSAVLYMIYGAFCIWGFLTWLRVKNKQPTPSSPAVEAVA